MSHLKFVQTGIKFISVATDLYQSFALVIVKWRKKFEQHMKLPKTAKRFSQDHYYLQFLKQLFKGKRNKRMNNMDFRQTQTYTMNLSLTRASIINELSTTHCSY